MERRVIKVLEARVELLANTPLIHKQSYFSITDVESLLSDYASIEDLPMDTSSDGTIVILDGPCSPEVVVKGNMAVARGPFEQLEAGMADKRYTLLGNQGLLYRFLLYLLEDVYQIFSFHANALYNQEKHELTVVFGGAASGKSPALMAGLRNGLTVFGTELVHFGLSAGNIRFYRSSALDNIRPQSINDDFPELRSSLKVPANEGFKSPSQKFLLDMRAFAAPFEVLDNPRLRMIVPHVEVGRKPVIATKVTDRSLMAKMLFDNLSEKISASFTMYNSIATCGLDSPLGAARRFAAVQSLLAKVNIQAVEVYLAPARYFLEVLK
jgi:hypothetical protein